MLLFRSALVLLFLPLAMRAEDTGKRVFEEINLARTQPRAYAQIVAAHAGRSRAVTEAVHFLERTAPRQPLTFSPGLTQAALSHVLDQGATGKIGHTGRDGARSFDRMARYGRWGGAAGENIDYGNEDPRSIVVRLIVDEGVPGRQHRANIFRPAFRVAGVAAGTHARFGAMCVIDFAGAFAERGAGLAAR